MKLSVKLENINYGDLAMLALPRLREKTFRSPGITSLIHALAGLPEQTLRQAVEQVPGEEKCAILRELFLEHQPGILRWLRDFLFRERLGISLSGLTLNQDLTLEAVVSHIDPAALTEKLMPLMKDRKQGSRAGILFSLPRPLWAGYLKGKSQEQLQKLACSLLLQQREAICRVLTEQMKKYKIRLTAVDFRAVF